ncbi:MAG: hypothetical protein KGL39_00130 [Patescibacteria group bacterium]|nr:hypothetical protein [Patescibacteria group bacterium]
MPQWEVKTISFWASSEQDYDRKLTEQLVDGWEPFASASERDFSFEEGRYYIVRLRRTRSLDSNESDVDEIKYVDFKPRWMYDRTEDDRILDEFPSKEDYYESDEELGDK